MSKRSKQTGNFYKKRTRLLNEAASSVDALNITLEAASTTIWPELGVEITQQDLESLFASCSSATGAVGSIRSNTIDNTIEIEDMDVSTEEGIDADATYHFMNNLNLKDALVHLITLVRASRFLTEGFLAILRKYFNAKVPKTKRTLLKTPSQIGSEIKSIQGGHLWYHGIEKVLLKYFE
ncbi:uncharacterized protein LOC128298578 [Anopheles moucheti]|uniref:uncharacterized protein LOC128298578 n=1 Tax=Anopheles moucheti TaxID=186751 RepID=UPI0022F14083|nr:uncharacterized protein LOC128298578 [Anopheles moucheti]